jgi:tetratricopeptide (TPR) repeat protein
MRRIWLFLAILAVTCGVCAAGYDDFTRGMSMMAASKPDEAITAFTAALAAGDLAPAYVPVVRLRRASAYMATGKCHEALADLDEVLKLKSGDLDAVVLHASANLCLKNQDAARRDIAAAIAIKPNAGIYEFSARSLWNDGDFAAAGRDFLHARQLTGKRDSVSYYLALWYAISAQRGGGFDAAAFDQAAAPLDLDEWPGALIDFFRGKTAEAKVYRAAQADDATKANERKCEADFYIGEGRLIHGDAAGAKPLLQLAADDCPKQFIEYTAARTELDRLK